MDYLAGAMDVKRVLCSGQAAATQYSDVVDAKDYRDIVFALDVGAVTGTSPTLDCKVQEATAEAVDTDLQVAKAVDAWTGLRLGASNNVKLSQAFSTSAGATPTYYRVEIPLKQVGTITSGNIWLTIEGDSTGDPDGTAVQTSEVVDATDITTDTNGETVAFTFRRPIALTASTDYHLVLQGDYSASTSNYIGWGEDTVASGGGGEVYDSSWADVATKDRIAQGYTLTFADISGKTWDQVTNSWNVANGETVEEVKVDSQDDGRYLRVVATIAGTTPKFDFCVMAICSKIVAG